MKKLSFYSFVVLLMGALFFTACNSSVYDGRTWEYGLTISDAESEGEADGGKGMQIFWNKNPKEGISIIKPYNLDRTLEREMAHSMFRIDYSGAGEDAAVVELGLPLSTVDSDERVVLLEAYSIYNVLVKEVKTIWPHASDEILEAWLINTEAPGFFNNNGFIQGGEVPGDEFLPLVERIGSLTPYNPKLIANLEIMFN